MAKKQIKKKAPLTANEFNLSGFLDKKGLKSVVKDKELSWIPFSKAYHEALGLPGVPKGYMSLFRGFSNTGKSTAGYETMASCQKMGVLPIYIDTENSFSWEHAKNIGVEYNEVVDEETGEIVDYEGFFMYVDNDTLIKKYGKYDYDEAKEKRDSRSEAVIEDVARFIDELLDAQRNGELPYELCFIWDSIGTLDCFKCVKSKSRNNMWNAGAMETSFKSIFNHKIPSSRKEGKEYTNTFVGIQKIWLDNMQGAGVVKHKGGEAAFFAARMIIHLGGTLSHGTSALKATNGGKDYAFGIKAKIKCVKNQVNGVEWEGVIASSPTGFMNPNDKAEYVKENRDMLLSILDVESGVVDIIEEEIDSNSIEDIYSPD